MSRILHLETTTHICSVAVAEDGNLLSLKETAVANSHSSLITLYAEEALKIANTEMKDLDAVCVSMGPGSYTGLRIGVSTAKGFCYALDIPLIAINTLQSMTFLYVDEYAKELNEETLLCPMIDARRMEVFTALFDKDIKFVKETSADIIDESSFIEILSKNKVIFFGDGATKCRQALSHNNNAIFNEKYMISAKGMIKPAWRKFQNREFENVAYFEPYYLKDFIATKPRKLV